ncbi:MAG: indolepyruvate oxidoreductase subunit beta [Treponema sp.]|nr:indolepyruvate oxidoreductase subunit beta [Treponema sp.]
MKCDVILAGVGGQGVLSIAAIIAQAAVSEGFNVRQSEVHGMAQRGGAVLAHLRISDGKIAGDLIPRGRADVIISMEPLESLRYVSYLKPAGAMVSAADPLVNIGNYPQLDEVKKAVMSLPLSRLVNAEALAKEAGNAKAVNMVMVGASSAFLPIKIKSLENTIEQTFGSKDSSVVEANKKAFQLGMESVK